MIYLGDFDMKPRTKTEKEVMRLSKKMGEICNRDADRLISKTYGSCAYKDMYNRCYAAITQAKGEWQVLRYFRIERHRNVKREVSYSLWEVVQLWMSKQTEVVVARQRTMGFYIDTFSTNSQLEIRRVPDVGLTIKDLPYSYLYVKSYTDSLRYISNEMAEVDNRSWRRVARFVLDNPFAETIVKRDARLAEAMVERRWTSQADLDAVKIALRHGYDISAMGYDNYFDYINALAYLGKDIHNPYYACPSNPMAAHDKYIAQMQRLRRWRAGEIALANAESENERYIGWRKRFFDMEITDGTISCKVLRSVKDFYEEGTKMHHCVFACKYYNKPYSLILSARIDGKHIETIEVDLANYKVAQCYGACDKFTIYHDRIVNLIKDNMNTIRMYDKKEKPIKAQAI